MRGALGDAANVQSGARADFVAWTAGSLDIQVTAWITVTDADRAADIAEMLLDLMQTVADAGAQLAFPAGAIRLETSDGLAQLASAAQALGPPPPGRAEPRRAT